MVTGIHELKEQPLLRLGAQMAEVEALYACLLDAPDSRMERRALLELAGAGSRLADLAHAAAGGREKATARHHTGLPRATSRKTKLQRRISGALRTADWIVTRAGGATG
jgi:hypothetical protein